MNDDDFSGIVRSGSQHSVSVSEHTGNAKTPKNIVLSREEETEARKRAFEEKALAALEAEKALAAALAEHTEHVASDGASTDTNIQKAATNKDPINRQGIAGEVAAKPNVQNVSTDALETNKQKLGADKIQDNIQSVGNGKGTAANVQNIAADVMATNQQSVDSSKIATNKQSIAGEKSPEANRQGISTDVVAPNQQNVGGGNIAANKQNIAGEKAIEANRQGIPTDVIAPNVQNIPVGGIAANVQDISDKPLTANNQAIAQDTPGLNRQDLDNNPAAAANLQALPTDDVAANRQSLGQDGNAKNQQGIPTDGIRTNEQTLAKLGVQDNQPAIAKDSFSTNRQGLAPAPSIAPNKQAIGTDAPTLNHQAAPQDAPPSTNRQGVDNGKIESHFETLPSGEIVRKKVDFATEAANPKTVAKPVAQSSARAHAPLTAAEQQEAKLKREKMMDEFHGRVAGIKHNVDALNHRLSDFEEKVHREDAKLIKGNPKNFDINLD